MAGSDNIAKVHAQIVARSWRDPAFKRKLLKAPAAALKEAGIATPKGMRIKVHENTLSTLHMVIPAKPKKPISEEELSKGRLTATLTCAG